MPDSKQPPSKSPAAQLTAIDDKTDALMTLLEPPADSDSPSKVDLLLELAQQQAELLAELSKEVVALRSEFAAISRPRQ